MLFISRPRCCFFLSEQVWLPSGPFFLLFGTRSADRISRWWTRRRRKRSTRWMRVRAGWKGIFCLSKKSGRDEPKKNKQTKNNNNISTLIHVSRTELLSCGRKNAAHFGTILLRSAAVDHRRLAIEAEWWRTSVGTVTSTGRANVSPTNSVEEKKKKKKFLNVGEPSKKKHGELLPWLVL